MYSVKIGWLADFEGRTGACCVGADFGSRVGLAPSIIVEKPDVQNRIRYRQVAGSEVGFVPMFAFDWQLHHVIAGPFGFPAQRFSSVSHLPWAKLRLKRAIDVSTGEASVQIR